ncbi:MAG: AmmeMemoRadiSam system protein A [bacterium]
MFYRQRLFKKEQQRLLEFARLTIKAKLNRDQPPGFDDLTHPYTLKRGVFVTLTRDKKLRGCIGMVQGVKPLYQAVADAAESAAFNDPRFPPVAEDELPKINIEISVISPLRKVDSVTHVKVPRHGVLLRLGNSSGILLPQVAAKNRWDRETLLEHVCLKAGLEKHSWKDELAEVMVFEAQVFAEETSDKPEDS